MQLRPTIRALKVALLLALLQCFVTTFGEQASARTRCPASTYFAIADFDGDLHADVATVQPERADASEARYWICFDLSAGGRANLPVTAPVGGVELSVRDVNGDSVADIVVSSKWLNRPVAVLLNDGHGHFAATKPSPLVSASYESCRYFGQITYQWQAALPAFGPRSGPYSLVSCSTLRTPLTLSRDSLATTTGATVCSLFNIQQNRAPPAGRHTA